MKDSLQHPLAWAGLIILAGCFLAFLYQDVALVFIFLVAAGIALAVGLIVRRLKRRGDL